MGAWCFGFDLDGDQGEEHDLKATVCCVPHTTILISFFEVLLQTF